MNEPLSNLRREARAALGRARVPNPAADADALLAGVLGRRPGDIVLEALLGRALSADEAADVRAAVGRRARREPLQHILGSAAFGDLELAVGPGVFVPRPETEVLVDVAIRRLHAAGRPRPLVADLGSGSGAVALGIAGGLLARRNPPVEPTIVAVEASPHTWPWLVRNVRSHGRGAVRAIYDRLGDRALGHAGRPFDAIVSNPPYVPRANEPTDPEVRRYDPGIALYGGDDGLDVIREIAGLGHRWLVPGGFVLLEHDDHHGDVVRSLLAAAGYERAETHRDLAGRDRVTVAYRPC
ncbi:release factor glutamine methyltransferase [Pseudoclavibacter endophyticus]|uniref:Release factor glutamine methyltransferase n=1 Tax=Pseudoclavibacter endophyticus TaxID=1778590 RepID=A0A6H9WT71_9MICO|nr:peptide chain release factor N(5)-glutamine methyltransferase [Pseudoclavibacter endophyticus]KAB1649885.1 peptide chain release factor N(5)-glutamine methyltransferase [Pseudoclavibacter endophyticus]GGA58995.1 release factor glutamine methyltransferase [Pseudoclavibacter endophyticus]